VKYTVFKSSEIYPSRFITKIKNAWSQLHRWKEVNSPHTTHSNEFADTLFSRNVMKARVKDAVGRQQKGHFGRQKLVILSKGISATKPSEHGLAGSAVSALGKSSAQDIELAHARKKILLDDTASVRSFIPSPIHVTPRTPRSYNRGRTRASEMHIPSPGARRSKVLDAVDLSESQCAGI
jgi:hypothetical protein